MLTLKFAPLAVIALSLAAAVSSAHAQSIDAVSVRTTVPAVTENSVPRLVQFSGTLRDAAARPVAGVVSVTFALYAEQDGGAPLWTETQNVQADASGHYATLLGVATSGGFPAELFSAGAGASRWLGVTIARQPEMARVLLASVPYALKAGDADTLGGLPASSYVTAQQLAAHSAIAPPATPVIAAEGVSPSGATGVTANGSDVALDSGVNVADANLASQPVTQLSGTGTAQYLPLWTSSTALGSSKIYQAKGGFVGINTNTPLTQLDVNGNSTFRGSFQLAPQGTATASTGQPSHSFQWQASVFNSGAKTAQNWAFGFRAVPVQNNTPFAAATLDLFYGPGGGTLTDTGLSIDSGGHMTFPADQQFNGDSALLNRDLRVFSDVSNVAAEVQDNVNFGVAVEAIVTGTESTAVSAYGSAIGVYAAGTVYAGDFQGDVAVTGTLTKAGGSFKIDDPIDPANKYLSHSFVESPDMKNVYDGVVTTDANGLATVTMPAWFEALNRDFRYQLTTIGQPAQAWVAAELANRVFTIRTDKPSVKVSWQITGIRQDAWANAHRIPVEQEKSTTEQGHFIHPELFGHAGELSVTAMRPGPDGKLVPIQNAAPVKK
jgi:hypothetical protein